MKLQQIKLVGFKSFVDNTIIDLTGNLVGIVGPNGCGKSNIIDAIRWVLGELSARQLRGDSMQDIIFNGSGNRKPISRASVELVFDNTSKILSGLWSNYDEISIKRLISRGGESLYYINAQVVRRRDITELFSGTGVGVRGYAIIEQGMISRIIDAKPDELRLYLEEAAGVSKYRERRKETLSKLQDTLDNLVRIEDINGELEKQIATLAEQAADAHKFQQLHLDLRLSQATLILLRINQAKSVLNNVNANLVQVDEQVKQLQAGLDDANIQLEAQLGIRSTKDNELSTITEEFNILRTSIARLEERIEYNKSLQVRIANDKVRLSQELLEQEQEVQLSLQHITESEESILDNSNHIQEQQLIREENSAIAVILEDEYQQYNQQYSYWGEQITTKKHELELLKNSCQHKQQQLNSLNIKLNKLEQDKPANTLDFNQSYFSIKDEVANLDIELIHTEEELSTVKLAKDELRANIENLLKQSYEAKADISVLDSKLHTIKELLYKQVTNVAIDDFVAPQDVLAPFWQNIVVLSGYELAVEIALNNLLNAVHIEDFNKIMRIPDSHLTFWVNNSIKFDVVKANQPNNWITLDKFVTVKEDSFANAYVILSQFIVCEDFKEALDVITCVKQDRQLIVTKDGHLVSGDYVIFNANCGHGHILEYQNKILVLENDLSNSMAQAAKIDNQLLQAKAAHDKHQHNLLRLSELYNNNLKLKHELQLKFTKEEQIFIQNKTHYQRIEQELSLLYNEISHVDDELSAIKIKIDDITIEIEYLQEKQNLAELEKTASEIRYNSAKSTLSALDLKLNKRIIDNQVVKQKIQNIASILHNRRDSIKRIKAKIDNLVEEEQNILSNDNGEIEMLHGNIIELATMIENKNAEIKAIGGSISQIRSGTNNLLQQKEQLMAKLNQLYLKQQEQEILIQSYNDGLAKEADIVADIDLTNEIRSLSSMQDHINNINSQIEQLGLVNLKSIEDLEQANIKYNDMEFRVVDLKDAMQTLEGAIKQIDEETRVLLNDTYAKVNQTFAIYFKTLFGGGDANLQLLDKDILQSGMQIFAQPLGKKNSSIQLLSGGEKALTAMSLVFALFSLNPAPFCLLDEVDAPLDDANTGRFCNLVQELSAKTQFIYISHNRLTMEIADQLVGVTMQEKGVSTTVSVNLVEAVKHAV